jgi:hypothetical protein
MRARPSIPTAACLALAAALALAPASPAGGQDAAPPAGDAAPAASAASAAEVTPQGARDLALQIKRQLRYWYIADRAPGIAFSMSVDVSAADDRYRAIVKNMRFEVEGLGSLDLGTVAADLAPLPHGRFDVDATLPRRIVFRSRDGGRMEATAAGRAMRGVFDPALQTLTAFDMRLDGISASVAGEPGRFTVGSMLAWADSAEVAAGRFDYGSVMEIRDLLFESPDRHLAIDRIWVDAEVGGLALPGYMDFYDEYLDILMPAEIEPGGADRALSVDQAASFADLLERTERLFESVDYEIGLAGFETGNGETFLLDEASLRFSGGPFGTGLSGLRFGLSVGPMTVAPRDPLMPNEIEIDIAVEDLPNRALWDGIIASMRAEEAGPAVGRRVLDAMAAAGSRLALETLSLRMPESWLEAEGELRTDPASPFGATGEGWVDMAGVNDYLTGLAADGDGRTPLITALTMLQTLARPEGGDDGIPIRRLEIELDEQGRVMVNGADIGPLLLDLQ